MSAAILNFRWNDDETTGSPWITISTSRTWTDSEDASHWLRRNVRCCRGRSRGGGLEITRSHTSARKRDHRRSGSRQAMFPKIQCHDNARIENLDRFLLLVDLEDPEYAIAVAFGQVVEIFGLGTPWSGRNDQPGELGSGNRRDPG